MDNLIDKEFFDLLVSHIVKITDENVIKHYGMINIST
jgi:hypothetical protein